MQLSSFQPYTIHHLQLGEVENFKAAAGNHYIIIWLRTFPLGNVWLQVEKTFQQTIFFNDVHKAIYSSVEYYMNNIDDNDVWKDLLAKNKFIQLETLVEKAIEHFKTTLHKNAHEKISVVICTRNRPVALQKCLSSLSKIDDENFEIIVVDNASDDDETKKVTQQFNKAQYVFEPRKGLDIARNTGALHASFDIIAYTDDDVIIPLNWIDNVRSCFANPLTMAVTGIVLAAELKTYAQYIFEKEWGFNKGYLPTVFNHAYFLKHKAEGVPAWDVGAGANMAFRRDIFNLAGLFDERLDVGASGCSGDSEMWYRILAEGWNCAYFPHLYVFHQHRESLEDLRKQLFSYMKGHVSALLVQFEKYGHKGNKKRIKKTLPKYYFSLLKENIIKIITGKFSSLITEIKGCRAGLKYYKAHNHFNQTNNLPMPQQLFEEVVVNDESLVSVIIPCYNQAHFLSQAIESVLNQTYKNVEIIVVNDGSTDNTKEVSEQYKVTHVYVERVGLPAARNIGVQFSKGAFIIFLDADDYLYENAIEVNLYFFTQSKNAAFISGGFNKIDDAGNYLGVISAQPKSGFNYISLLQGNYIAMEGAVMYRRELFFYFHFNPQLQSCEDYDLNLRISREFPVYHHEKKIAVYRWHTTNMSANKARMLNSALLVLQLQKPFLKTAEEKQAFEQGIKNWKEYYNFSKHKPNS